MTRALTAEHAALRHEIAQALRRARGAYSQVEFVPLLRPLLGRSPAVDQWSKYEREDVDPPAYIVLAAERAAKLAPGELLASRDQLEELTERVDTLVDRLDELLRPDRGTDGAEDGDSEALSAR